MATIIQRNTTIPAKYIQTFTTNSDNQTNFDIKVFEGESPMAKDNHLLGRFIASPISQVVRGTARIDVTIDIDQNGIVVVSAVDKTFGKEKKMTVTNDNRRLPKDELDRIIMEAQIYKVYDEIERERIAAKDLLESYCFDTKTKINDEKLENPINDYHKKKIDLIQETEKWLETNQVRLISVFIFHLEISFSWLKKKNLNIN
jgi:L1 cell adhesion molecule like protein